MSNINENLLNGVRKGSLIDTLYWLEHGASFLDNVEIIDYLVKFSSASLNKHILRYFIKNKIFDKGSKSDNIHNDLLVYGAYHGYLNVVKYAMELIFILIKTVHFIGVLQIVILKLSNI